MAAVTGVWDEGWPDKMGRDEFRAFAADELRLLARRAEGVRLRAYQERLARALSDVRARVPKAGFTFDGHEGELRMECGRTLARLEAASPDGEVPEAAERYVSDLESCRFGSTLEMYDAADEAARSL